MYFYRRVRYVDSNSLQYRVSNIGAAHRVRERLRFRLLSRFQKILNALIGILTVLAIVVAAIDLYVGGIPTIAHDSAAALQAGTQVSNLLLISLILLPLFHPIVDIVNWQRLAAFEKERDWNYFGGGKWTAAFKSFCATYAVEVPLVRLLICLLGAVAGLTLATPDRGDVGYAFIAQLVAQENFVATTVLSFLLFSLFAMAISTMSSLFAASLCTIRYDILPMFWSKSTSAQTLATQKAQAIRWTMIAGAGMGFAVFAAFYVADTGLKITFASARFLVLVFGFSCFQLSFVPSYWDRSSPDLADVEPLAPDGPSPLWVSVPRSRSAPPLPILQPNMTCCCRSRCPVVSDRALYFFCLHDSGCGRPRWSRKGSHIWRELLSY